MKEFESTRPGLQLLPMALCMQELRVEKMQKKCVHEDGLEFGERHKCQRKQVQGRRERAGNRRKICVHC